VKLTKKMTAGILALALATPAIANNNPSTADEQHEFLTIQSEKDSEQFNRLSQDKFVGANMQLLFDQSDHSVQLAELSQVEMSQTQGAFFNWGQIINITATAFTGAAAVALMVTGVGEVAAAGAAGTAAVVEMAGAAGAAAADVAVGAGAVPVPVPVPVLLLA